MLAAARRRVFAAHDPAAILASRLTRRAAGGDSVSAWKGVAVGEIRQGGAADSILKSPSGLGAAPLRRRSVLRGFWPLRVGGTGSESLGHPSHSDIRVTRTSESLGQCRVLDSLANVTPRPLACRHGPRAGPRRGGRRNGRGRGLRRRLGRRLSKRLGKPPETFPGSGPSAVSLARHRPPDRTRTSRAQASGWGREHSALHMQYALAASAASVAKAPDALASHRRVPSHCSAACGESTLHVRAPGFPSHYPSRAVLSPVLASRLYHPARRQGSSSIFRVSSSLSDPNPHCRWRVVQAARRGGVWDLRPLPSGA